MLRFLYVLFIQSTSHSSGTVVKQCASVAWIVLISESLCTDYLNGYPEGKKQSIKVLGGRKLQRLEQ